jgi:hypothetical protein
MNRRLPLSVVVVVRDAAATIDVALSAVLASEMPREDYELIVVDDASSDASPAIAARYADTVIRLTGPQSGPAYSRNRGAEMARGAVVAFLDVDAKVRPQTLPGMLEMLAKHPGLDAIAASHDDRPAAPNFASQYWNLLLHFSEQCYAPVEGALTSGCAAIRRSVLFSVGMYDEWRFGPPSLESVELGKRLMQAGHGVMLSRDLQITPLRRWSFAAICREVWNRSALLARSLGYKRTRLIAPTEVVFTLSQLAAPALAIVGAILVFTASFAPHSQPKVLSVAAAGICGANFSVYRFFLRTRGLAFTIAVAPVHLLMQCVAAVALCVGRLMRDTVGDRLPDAATQAYAEVGLETWPPVRRLQ